jgi:hypothetical protein
MGAKYHTIHHEQFLFNYGQVVHGCAGVRCARPCRTHVASLLRVCVRVRVQFFTFCDKFFGTLKLPKEAVA